MSYYVKSSLEFYVQGTATFERKFKSSKVTANSKPKDVSDTMNSRKTSLYTFVCICTKLKLSMLDMFGLLLFTKMTTKSWAMIMNHIQIVDDYTSALPTQHVKTDKSYIFLYLWGLEKWNNYIIAP